MHENHQIYVNTPDNPLNFTEKANRTFSINMKLFI